MKRWRQIIFFALALGGIYYFFNSYLTNMLNHVSKIALTAYFNSTSNSTFLFDKYLNQASSIESLKQENKLLTEQTISFYSRIKQLKQDSIFNNFEANSSFYNVYDANVLGYSALPNLYRVWLSIDTNNTSKSYGLIVPLPNKIDSVACGVATYRQASWEGYLNGDVKASYAVSIGQNSAPGIILGHSSGKIIARYIPAWIEIKVGDEVVTSGIDKLFFEGVKVGIVKEINNDNTYNEALIEPFCNSFSPSRYFAIRKND